MCPSDSNQAIHRNAVLKPSRRHYDSLECVWVPSELLQEDVEVHVLFAVDEGNLRRDEKRTYRSINILH